MMIMIGYVACRKAKVHRIVPLGLDSFAVAIGLCNLMESRFKRLCAITTYVYPPFSFKLVLIKRS
jgi:hypothetical protein